MKGLRLVLGLEAAALCQGDALLRVGSRCWKRTCLRFFALQAARHFSSSKKEMLDKLYSASQSTESVRLIHHRANAKPLRTDEPTVEFNSTSKVIEPTSHIEMIRQYFDVSKTTAYRILDKEKCIKDCNVHILSRNMNTLQRNGVDPADVRNHVALLCRCPLTTEHNIAALRELGLNNLTAQYLAQSLKLFRRRVSLIKRWGLLPDCYDPLEVLDTLQLPHHVFNNVQLSDINNLTLEQLHQKLSSEYLAWRLNCSEEEVSKLQQTYTLARKSMKLQMKVLLQLEHDWNIHISKILQNGYLLTCSPVNMALMDSKVKEICGISIKEYALMTPRILTIPYHQLIQVDRILSSLQVPQASVKTLPRISTLHPDTLQERINLLRQIPEYHALQSHPRMLHLIYYHRKVISRLDLLQQSKDANSLPSLNKLSGSKKRFDKYLKVGDMRQNKKDVIMCLSKQLSVKPDAIRKCLHLQCWGSQTTVMNVQRNLSTLRELGFTEEQLMAGLDVVLYPPDLLHDQLAQLPHRPQVQPFSTFRSNINVLQLLLYFMEKNASLR